MRIAALVTVSLLGSLSLVACKDKEAPSAAPTGSAAASGGATKPAPTATATAPAADAPSPAKLGLKPGEQIAASCDTISVDGECGELLVTDAAQKADAAKAMKSLCTKGTVGTTCPTADIVGSCREGKDMLKHYYGHGGKTYDAAKAKAACTKGYGHPVEG